MNTKYIYFVVGAVVLVGLFVFGGKKTAVSPEKMDEKVSVESTEKEIVGDTTKAATTSESMQAKTTPIAPVTIQKGSYETYTAEKIAEKGVSGKVVLFFHASWCPTCRGLDQDIRANLALIPSGVTILDVDYDTAQALRVKYKVTYQHTFVQVSPDGTQIKKWAGSPTLTALVKEIQ